MIGSATLNGGGVATLTTSNLNADSYQLTAIYVGDSANLGSTSPFDQLCQHITIRLDLNE